MRFASAIISGLGLATATLLMGCGQSGAPLTAAPGVPGDVSEVAHPLSAAPLPDGWKESVGTQESPIISTENDTATTLVLLFVGQGEEHRLTSGPGRSSISIPPGEYTYSLLGPHYEQSGDPDQSGLFRCRKYREYVLPVTVIRDDTGPEHRDLGD